MFFQVCRPELWVDTREVALLTGRNTNRLKTKEEVKSSLTTFEKRTSVKPSLSVKAFLAAPYPRGAEKV